MPQLGEVKRGSEIGYKDQSHSFMWLGCPNCGTERWILLKNGEPQRFFCKPCVRRGMRSEAWQGGIQQCGDGHVRVRLESSDPFYAMTESRKSRVLVHRLLMAQHLGRCLESWEVVHHLNGVPGDNRIENLVLTTNSEHVSSHRRQEVAAGIDPFHGKGYRREPVR